MEKELKFLIVERLLDWPFLAFVLFVLTGVFFYKPIRERIASVVEMSFGEKTKIILGTKEVAANEIGDALTVAFRELEQRVEVLEIQHEEAEADIPTDTDDGSDDIPQGLKDFLWRAVYPMLNSEYWYARYVTTLANKTSVTPELMERFLRERPEVELFEDNKGLLASLRNKTKGPR